MMLHQYQRRNAEHRRIERVTRELETWFPSLSARTAHGVVRAFNGEATISTILRLTDEQFLNLRNMGPHALREFREAVGDPYHGAICNWVGEGGA